MRPGCKPGKRPYKRKRNGNRCSMQELENVIESWLRESEQSVEWIFCLTAARVLVAN